MSHTLHVIIVLLACGLVFTVGAILWWQGDPSEREELLLKELQSSDAMVRKKAAVELSRLESSRAAPQIAEMLATIDDSSDEEYYVDCLANYGKTILPHIFNAFGEFLDTPGKADKVRCLAILLERVEASPEDLLFQACALRDRNARLLALLTVDISMLSSTPEVNRCVAELLRDEDHEIRVASQKLRANTMTTWATLDAGSLGERAKKCELEVFERLKAQLVKGSTTLRVDAARLLAEIGPPCPSVVPVLLEALNDPEPKLREEAVRALGSVASEAGSAASDLVALLEKDESTDVRAAAAAALGEVRVSPDTAIPALIAVLGEEQPEVLVSAASALGRYGHSAAKSEPALKALLDNRASRVRRAAATSLGLVGDDPAGIKTVLFPMLQDDDPSVRMGAVAGLAHLGPEAKDVTRRFRELLQDHDDAVRCAAAEALWSLGVHDDSVGYAVLDVAVNSHNIDARRCAWNALEGYAPVVTRLASVMAALPTPVSPSVRCSAARVIWKGTQDASAVLPVLRHALRSDAPPILAVQTLGEMGEAAGSALEDLVGLLSHSDLRVRVAAARAMARVLGTDG